jgi:hypothetical protein
MGHKVIFAGCSDTAGNGWVNLPADQSLAKECKDSPYFCVNLCHKKIPRIRDLELVNIGRGSATNTDIYVVQAYPNTIYLIFTRHFTTTLPASTGTG